MVYMIENYNRLVEQCKTLNQHPAYMITK